MMIISEQYAQGKGIRVLRQSAFWLADFKVENVLLIEYDE